MVGSAAGWLVAAGVWGMTKRSKVQLYEQIRRVDEREKLSIRALSRRFGVHRRDVRAALASAVPAPRKTPERPAPKMDRFKAIIDGWLEADRSLPRKQRHTARRVWQRLVAEHDADCGRVNRAPLREGGAGTSARHR